MFRISRRLDQRGFTLPEVLVVGVVLIGLLATVIAFMRPVSFANTEVDAERRLGLALLAQALEAYRTDKGAWPPGIAEKELVITNQKGGVDLCAALVPAYLADIPSDPQLGSHYTGEDLAPVSTSESCDQPDVTYVTGYAVRLEKDGAVTLRGSSSAVRGQSIDVVVR